VLQPVPETVLLPGADRLQLIPAYTAEHTTYEDTAAYVGLFRWDFHASALIPLLAQTVIIVISQSQLCDRVWCNTCQVMCKNKQCCMVSSVQCHVPREHGITCDINPGKIR